MDTPIFLSLEDILEIHQDQISRYGGDPGIRDANLIDSAMKAPGKLPPPPLAGGS
jgi:death-on-curing protein